MNYYLVVDGKVTGPFSKAELKLQDVTPSSYVWYEGLDKWKTVDSVQELSDLFSVDEVKPVRQEEIVEPSHVEVSQAEPVQHSSSQHVTVEQPEYKIAADGQSIGPMTKCGLARSGFLDYDSFVWYPRIPEWVKASAIPGLKALLDNVALPEANQPADFYISITKGINVTNGHLFVFDDYITIRPNRATSVMMGNMSKSGFVNQYYSMDEIIGLEKGFMAKKFILLTDGRKVGIAYKKNDIFEEIASRREAYYRSRGLEVPPLVDKS